MCSAAARFALAATLALRAGSAHADASTSVESECRRKVAVAFPVVRHEGREGNWLSREDANRVVFVLSVCVPLYEKQLEAQALVLDTRRTGAELSAKTASAALQLAALETRRADDFKAELKSAETRVATLEEKVNSPWRAPGTWFAVGALTTIIIVVGAAVTAAQFGGS